jgi:hypothetical protein
MTIGQRFLRVAMLTATLFSAQASRGQDAASWDGTWNGTLGKNHPWPISVSIANGKVVGFTEKGAATSSLLKSLRLPYFSATRRTATRPRAYLSDMACAKATLIELLDALVISTSTRSPGASS